MRERMQLLLTPSPLTDTSRDKHVGTWRNLTALAFKRCLESTVSIGTDLTKPDRQSLFFLFPDWILVFMMMFDREANAFLKPILPKSNPSLVFSASNRRHVPCLPNLADRTE